MLAQFCLLNLDVRTCIGPCQPRGYGCRSGRPSLVVSFEEGLEANLEEHREEMMLSAELGFERPASEVSVVDWEAQQIKRSALGMGPACPFHSDDLIVTTTAPVFSASECKAVQEEALTYIEEGSQSTFTMTDTNRDVGLHELTETVAWLNSGAFVRVTSLAASAFPSAISNASSLWIYRGLVVRGCRAL